MVSNDDGSATGTGSVQVDGGVLGGSGLIAGAVTIGTGSGTGATLAPSVGTHHRTSLRLQSALTFKADATYAARLYPQSAKADQVTARGVTIGQGAEFSFIGDGSTIIAPGTVFFLIKNTAATAIAGNFSNLADGSLVEHAGNNFQVSYEGGDGNDLTLTVVP